MSLLHSTGSAGISTCLPSPTTPVLGLGRDLPWADEPSPGNLGPSTGTFPTCLSLLIPAFSLLYRPRVLTVTLQPVHNAPLPLVTMISTFLTVACFAFPHLPRSHQLARSRLRSDRSRGKTSASLPGKTEIIVTNPPLRWHVLAPDIFGAQPLDQ